MHCIVTERAKVFIVKLESGRLQEGEEGEKKQPRQPLPRKILDLFAISDKCNGRLVVYVNDNKVDVEEEPEVHLLDPDVVPAEVLLHHKHEPIKITSEENQQTSPRATYRTDPVTKHLGEV